MVNLEDILMVGIGMISGITSGEINQGVKTEFNESMKEIVKWKESKLLLNDDVEVLTQNSYI